MERLAILRAGRGKVAAAALVGMMCLPVLEGCASAHPASSGSDVYKQITSGYPGATDIQHHFNHGINTMSWKMPDGKYCEANASPTEFNDQQPKELTSTPICGELTPPEPTSTHR